MGAEGAVGVLFRSEARRQTQARAGVDKYQRRVLNPYQAASRGVIDTVIEPQHTRAYLSVRA
jgi:propionyl-CoA carboxylase beta chain